MKFEFATKDVNQILVDPIPWMLWPDEKSAERVHTPNLYRKEQTKHQGFNVPETSTFWKQCRTVLELKIYRLFANRDYPGYVIPPHRDNHSTFRKEYGISDDVPVYRYWVPLIDHQFGHVLCVDGEFIKYKAGDVIEWGDKIHSAANIGFAPRLYLMITGTKDA